VWKKNELQHNAVRSRKMLKAICFASVFVLISAAAEAQGTLPVNPVYRRAQTLVNDGNAAAGRALVDSMIAVAAPGSNDYAEAIYWRAVIASTAADAETDYRRIVVDYPRSPRVEDALIRLAQLEIARANYDAALKHLNQLVTEHPDSPARARASYWSARGMFDKNDVQGGCAATADALARTNDADTELRNQISYLNQRCAGISLTPAPAAPTPAAPATLPAAPVTTPSQPAAPPVDSVKTTPEKTAPTPVETPAPKIVKPSPQPPPVIKPADEPAAGEKVWSVQVAAYNVKSQADAMVTKLRKSGYEARVDGSVAPFRVRIGQYKTQAQASAVQRSLKAKQIAGFVVQAEIR
jgi:cell division septation protein DedD